MSNVHSIICFGTSGFLIYIYNFPLSESHFIFKIKGRKLDEIKVSNDLSVQGKWQVLLIKNRFLFRAANHIPFQSMLEVRIQTELFVIQAFGFGISLKNGILMLISSESSVE